MRGCCLPARDCGPLCLYWSPYGGCRLGPAEGFDGTITKQTIVASPETGVKLILRNRTRDEGRERFNQKAEEQSYRKVSESSCLVFRYSVSQKIAHSGAFFDSHGESRRHTTGHFLGVSQMYGNRCASRVVTIGTALASTREQRLPFAAI